MKRFAHMLIEGGVGGHIDHPFDIAKNGRQLLKLFDQAVDYIREGSASVKIDGINISVRVSEGKFVIDRGSAKILDIEGVRPDTLEARFGEGHGMVEKGRKVLEILDAAYPVIQSDLNKLKMTTNENILLNLEYVEGAASNVIEYKGISNFLAIHGLMKIEPKNVAQDGTIISRRSYPIPYDKNVLNRLIKKLNDVAKKYSFSVIGSVNVELKNKPNFNSALSEKIEINSETKSLKQWLLQATRIEQPITPRKDILSFMNINNPTLDDKQRNDYIVFLATLRLGDELLKSTTSTIGDLETHEGIVIDRKNGEPYKITGSFMIRGLLSPFEGA